MTVIILFPYLYPFDLVKFSLLSKQCNALLVKYVNFKVLFEAYGIMLSSSQVEETLISRSRALLLATKLLIEKFITKS